MDTSARSVPISIARNQEIGSMSTRYLGYDEIIAEKSNLTPYIETDIKMYMVIC